MTKKEFLQRLEKGLKGVPKEDIEERIAFYGEMIDDRIEDGLSEEEAVANVGDVDGIISQIIADVPLTKLVKEKIRPKRTLSVWEIVLIVLGFPIWFPLGIAICAIVLSAYIVLWALVLSLWVIDLAFAVTAIGLVAAGVVSLVGGGVRGTVVIGTGIIFAGLSILLFFGCKYATKGAALLTKRITLWIKSLFVKKEEI